MAPKRDAAASQKKQKRERVFQKTSPLFEKILLNKPFENVIRNVQHHFWEDSETGTVFDPVSRMAVGVHVGSGQIRSLSVADLEVAKERGWKTVAVENLKHLDHSDS